MNEVSFAESIDRLKESFLWAAAQSGNLQDCEALLEFGADVNWKHTNGDTPLLVACRRGHADTVALLLAHGADSNIAGTDSLAPIHIAATRGDSTIMDKLLDANASVSLKTRDGHTALDIAKTKGHEAVYGRLMGTRRPLPNRTPSAHNALVSIPSTTAARENLPALGNALRPLQTVDTSLPAVNASLASTVGERSSSARRKKTTPDPMDRSYSIMGDMSSSSAASTGGSPEETIALKKLLESEISKRRVFEAKLEVFTTQNKQLLEELTNMNTKLQSADLQIDALSAKLRRSTADEVLVQSFAIEDCEALEHELKAALQRVEKRKAILIRNQIEGQKEQRLCVICCEKEKSVVLLPCRHMCLCDQCSLHAGLDVCPLCRECIVHKISVFS